MNAGNVRVAIVGAGTLKGRELADVLNDRNFPARDIRLLDDEEALGQLEAVGEEPTFIQSVLPEHFHNVDFAFFTSDEAFTRKTRDLAQRAGASIIDLSYGLEGEMDVAIRAPWIERELRKKITPDLRPAPVVIAHPAAQVLALLLLRAQKAAPVSSAVATVFEPASEQGKSGMDELHEQTVNLLSFRELPKQVFDTQMAFNVVTEYGEQAKASPLQVVERRISGHYKRLVGTAAPVPSLMLVQAPSFHGHVFSLYVEFERIVDLKDLANLLTCDHIEVTHGAEQSPNNVNAAGEEDILVSLRHDAQHDRGVWLWAAADNLRIAAVTAVECAESLLPARPKGSVQ